MCVPARSLPQVGRGEHHAEHRDDPADDDAEARALAEHDDREHHADERVGRADRRHHRERAELERPVVGDVGGRGEHRVQRRSTRPARRPTARSCPAASAMTVTTAALNVCATSTTHRLPIRRPVIGAGEVGEAPAERRDEAVDHAAPRRPGVRASASASTATAPVRPTSMRVRLERRDPVAQVVRRAGDRLHRASRAPSGRAVRRSSPQPLRLRADERGGLRPGERPRRELGARRPRRARRPAAS